MKDVPRPATLYEDVVHTNEIIKLFVGSPRYTWGGHYDVFTHFFLNKSVTDCNGPSLWGKNLYYCYHFETTSIFIIIIVIKIKLLSSLHLVFMQLLVVLFLFTLTIRLSISYVVWFLNRGILQVKSHKSQRSYHPIINYTVHSWVIVTIFFIETI